MTPDQQIALASVISSGAVAMAAVIGSVVTGHLDRRARRKDAQISREQPRLERTYLELATYVHRRRLEAEAIMSSIALLEKLSGPVSDVPLALLERNACSISDAAMALRWGFVMPRSKVGSRTAQVIKSLVCGSSAVHVQTSPAPSDAALAASTLRFFA